MPKDSVKAELKTFSPTGRLLSSQLLVCPGVTAWGGSGCSGVSHGQSAFLVYAPGTHSSGNTRSRRDDFDVQRLLFPKITFVTCMKDNTILN